MNDEPSPATWAETNRAALDAHAEQSVGILLVYESSNELAVRMNDDAVSRLQGWFDEELRRSQHVFPFHSMPELVRFDFEAWDVIERDYKGSVYLRLRERPGIACAALTVVLRRGAKVQRNLRRRFSAPACAL